MLTILPLTALGLIDSYHFSYASHRTSRYVYQILRVLIGFSIPMSKLFPLCPDFQLERHKKISFHSLFCAKHTAKRKMSPHTAKSLDADREVLPRR